jgi:hypothetical protein
VCGIKRIYLIAVSVDAAMFKEELGDAYKRLAAQYKEIRTAHMKALLEQPDYQVLLGYMIYALYWLHGREPEARKLDFVIERKKKLSHWFEQSHDDLPGALVEWGKPELVRLVGVLEDVKKEDQRRPVEAADLLSWYRQRADANLIQDGTPDLERVRRLFELPGNGFTVPREQMAGLFASMVLRSGDDAIT